MKKIAAKRNWSIDCLLAKSPRTLDAAHDLPFNYSRVNLLLFRARVYFSDCSVCFKQKLRKIAQSRYGFELTSDGTSFPQLISSSFDLIVRKYWIREFPRIKKTVMDDDPLILCTFTKGNHQQIDHFAVTDRFPSAESIGRFNYTIMKVWFNVSIASERNYPDRKDLSPTSPG